MVRMPVAWVLNWALGRGNILILKVVAVYFHSSRCFIGISRIHRSLIAALFTQVLWPLPVLETINVSLLAIAFFNWSRNLKIVCCRHCAMQ